ncbi:hypothetical protein AC578_2607 [Pseudocercospora eumusae]|uniref:DUF8035 domain-containing protein n=1 Tax=Pseudocercospora eumusae TaxID=321146 RepID=A0A139H7U5_9PEZI|nr:hypothetical protein AC578_2607 [Pseudocercospora eumusae]KXS98494.1 hypothetical protein AC578_2607 [Pseudocercospora eumusae]
MSRFRSSDDDLAYGDIPQRWDRERFERFGSRGGPPRGTRFEDDYYYHERDRPGHRDVAVAERVESRGPRRRWVYEEDREIDARREPSRRRRRTDRELFGDVDPREIADMALMPYRRKSITREDFDIDQRVRPGLLRRQSSLDTFDRRRRHDDEYRIPPYTPVLLPIRRQREWEGYYEPEDYREVEIQRERSVHRRRRPKSVKESVKSKSSSSSSSSSSSEESVAKTEKTHKTKSHAPSPKPSTKAKSSRATSVHESIHETSVSESLPPAPPPPAPVPESSFHETLIEQSIHAERKFKKGKTRMPKRLVRVEAIMDLGYPFEEEEDFYVLQIALEKEQIDEVIQISETYKNGEKKKVYRFEEKIEEAIPAPPVGEHEEIQRTEWINPPTVIARRGSPSAKSSISQVARSRSRRPSSPGTYVEKRETIIEESAPPPPPPPPAAPEFYEEKKTIIEERSPSHHHHAGSLVLADREHRSDRDINAEIRYLEQERRALRLEREAGQKLDLALRLRERPEEEFQLVEYRDRSRPRQETVIYERERSPPRNVVRVEKDRKGRMALVRSSH